MRSGRSGRFGRRLLQAGGVALLVAVGTLTGLLATPAGARWVLSQLVGPALAPATLTVEGLSGNLWQGVHAKRLRYQSSAFEGDVEGFEARWALSTLRRGELDIALLGAERVALRVATTQDPSSESFGALPAIVLPSPPLPVTLSKLAIATLTLDSGAKQHRLSQISGRARWLPERIAIERLTLKHALPDGTSTPVSLQADAALNAPLLASLSLHVEVEHAAVPGTTSGLPLDLGPGHLTVSGPLTGLAFGYSGTPPLSELKGTTTLAVSDRGVSAQFRVEPPWALSARVALDQLDLSKATVEAEVTARDWPIISSAGREWSLTSGRVELMGTLAAQRFELDVAGRLAPVGAVALTASGSATGQVLQITQMSIGMLDGTLDLAGRLGIAPPMPVSGEIVVRGLDLSRLRPDAATFEDALQLSASLPDARVDADLQVDLAQISERPLGDIRIRSLRGQWRGQPLQADGAVQILADGLAIPTLTAVLGDNRLSGHARIGEVLEATGALEIRDFTQFDPAWRGDLAGQFSLSGTRAAPRIKTRVSGANLDVAGLSVGKLDGVIDADLTQVTSPDATAATSVAEVTLSTVAGPGLAYRSAAFRIDGSREAHRITARLTPMAPAVDAGNGRIADFDSPAMRLLAHGGLGPGSDWRGQVDVLSISQPLLGSWELLRPAPVAWTREPTERRLEDFCLTREPSSLCLEMTGMGASGTVKASLSALPLAWLEPWVTPDLPEDWQFSGQADVKASLAQRGASMSLADIDADATIALSNAGLEIPARFGEAPLGIALTEAAADVQLGPSALALNLSVLDRELGRVSLAASLARGTAGPIIDARSALAMSAQIDLPALGRLSPLWPALEGTKGALALTATGRGTPLIPELALDLDGPTFELPLPMAGISVHQPSLTVSTDSDGILRFSGAVASSAGGTLSVTGTLPSEALVRRVLHPDTATQARAPEDWPLMLSVEGESVTVTELSELAATVSPALRVRSDLSRRVDIQGRVHLPQFSLELAEVPQGSASVSRDQVLVDAQGVPSQPKEVRAPLPLAGISGNVRVSLGESVQFSAFGLQTALKGALDVRREADAQTLALASGRISMQDGRFEAYGQPLKITRGEFLFAGPMDNPAISLRAVRPDLPIEAGVAVSGTVRTPRLDLFSSPVQDDANTLAYIITGRPLSAAGGSNASMLLRAAQSLGLEQANAATTRLKDTLQLNELTVGAGFEEDGQIESSSLVMGKQLSDEIGLRTELDLFDRLWSFFITYRINEHWSLEAESGVRNAAGVVYTFDREKLFDIAWPWQRAAVDDADVDEAAEDDATR